MYLHDAMKAALKAVGRFMTAAELADEVNRRGEYAKRDGSLVEPGQIRARVRQNSAEFAKSGSLIGLPSTPAPRPVDAPATSQASTPPADDLLPQDLRRKVVRILNAVDRGGRTAKEGIGARIGRLSHEGVIPRHIAASMRAITETRNAEEYEEAKLTRAQIAALRANWEAVVEWAVSEGVVT